jgi:hypothetical protein
MKSKADQRKTRVTPFSADLSGNIWEERDVSTERLVKGSLEVGFKLFSRVMAEM